MELADDRNAAVKIAATVRHALAKDVGEDCDEEPARRASGLDAPRFAAGLAAGLRLGWLAAPTTGVLRLTAAGRSAAGPAILWPSPLRKAARGLKGPTSPDFDPAAWVALAGATDVAIDDLRLVASAVWLSRESAALKSRFAADHAKLGGGARSTLLAVAAVNREYGMALGKHAKASRRLARNSPGEVVDLDVLATLPVRNAMGQHTTMDNYLDGAGDTLASWLHAACGAAGGAPLRAWSDNLDGLAAQHLLGYSIQHAHYDLAQAALWDGWGLAENENRWQWIPGDAGFAKLSEAWNVRNRSNLIDHPSVAIAAWREAPLRRRRELDLPLAVTAVKKGARGGRSIVVGPPAIGKDAPAYLVARESLENSYLGDFLDVPLPLRPELNCRVLLRAWCVC